MVAALEMACKACGAANSPQSRSHLSEKLACPAFCFRLFFCRVDSLARLAAAFSDAFEPGTLTLALNAAAGGPVAAGASGGLLSSSTRCFFFGCRGSTVSARQEIRTRRARIA